MDPDRSTAVFRILQESLTNVVRHAAASEITIRMEKRNKDLMLLVKDNGKGMRMEDAFRDESLGILGMRERAQMFGGEVDICSAPGSGTTVRVNIPQVYVA
jgi:two-component system sensor histidine kinase UhpB